MLKFWGVSTCYFCKQKNTAKPICRNKEEDACDVRKNIVALRR